MGFWLGLIALGAYFWVVPVSYLRPLKPVVSIWFVILLIAWFPYAIVQRLIGNRVDDQVGKIFLGGLVAIAAYMGIAFVVAAFVKLTLWLKRLVSKAVSN